MKNKAKLREINNIHVHAALNSLVEIVTPLTIRNIWRYIIDLEDEIEKNA